MRQLVARVHLGRLEPPQASSYLEFDVALPEEYGLVPFTQGIGAIPCCLVASGQMPDGTTLIILNTTADLVWCSQMLYSRALPNYMALMGPPREVSTFS
jgi:hypothetical protein